MPVGAVQPDAVKKSLIDVIRKDINRSDSRGSSERDPPPDWLRVVEDALLRQDMLWVLDQMSDVG